MVTSYGHCLAQAVPTLRIKDPAYQEKMANIDAALARCDADNPVFYEDEVDIDLNPKLGADWMFRAQQKRVVTPGQNAGIIWQAFSTQATEGYFTSAGSRKTHRCLLPCWKSCATTTDEPNHHVDPITIIHKKQTDRAMVEEESPSSAWCSSQFTAPG